MAPGWEISPQFFFHLSSFSTSFIGTVGHRANNKDRERNSNAEENAWMDTARPFM
jgi:hypothetical protein